MELDLIQFFLAFFVGFLSCYGLDKLSLILYRRFGNNPNYSQNTRWFFIHFVINAYVTIAGLSDIFLCLTKIDQCATREWINGYWPYGVAVSLHFYHIAAFKLTQIDWIHHCATAIVSTPVLLACSRTPSAVMALWFMSGFPGGIDYFLLWLVKMGYLDSKVEKKAYVAISVWLRAPGCIMTCALQLGILQVLDQMPVSDIVGGLWNTMIVFWNGLYFMQHTLASYYTKLPEEERKRVKVC